MVVAIDPVQRKKRHVRPLRDHSYRMDDVATRPQLPPNYWAKYKGTPPPLPLAQWIHDALQAMRCCSRCGSDECIPLRGGCCRGM
ncbi:hypothetical protein Sjap_023512 [Stephania japonica]|uniref:Uncharacterized protein n=1 Tax=Stephania japonica TaxID=461633 RepID=A0AAP0EDV8_9MAGN